MQDELREAIIQLVQCARAKVGAGMKANLCGTTYDIKKAHHAEIAYDEQFQKVELLLKKIPK